MSLAIAEATTYSSELKRFIASWTHEDCALRFGGTSHSLAEWLAHALSTNQHKALAARESGEIIGLLDYATVGASAEFGIFVADRDRRRGVGTNLVSYFIARTAAELIYADCRADNVAAIALLRATRFTVVASCGAEMRWQREPISR